MKPTPLRYQYLNESDLVCAPKIHGREILKHCPVPSVIMLGLVSGYHSPHDDVAQADHSGHPERRLCMLCSQAWPYIGCSVHKEEFSNLVFH